MLVQLIGKRRLKLTIAYDGRPWRGWQSQVGRVTVQDAIEGVLAEITGTRIVLHGSGRTDAGVHALGQVAHIDVEESDRCADTWLRAMNSKLPPSIRVIESVDIHPDFHARFDATGKIYEYRLWKPAVLSPFEVGLAWHPWGTVDVGLVREGAAILQGRHNFARLSANRGHVTEIERRRDMELLVRDVRRIEVFEDEHVVRIVFEGDGFMYRMVRLMVGAMIRVARGKDDMSWLRDLVADPEGEKNTHCAPADGLYLMRVLYDEP
jgi:tRNA pseudouridine38-40 synthase